MPRSYQTVLARIEDDLTAGRLAVGGRLPAERALAEQYGVSRPSVREAIRVLEAMGLIRTAAGSGPDAGAVLIADPAAPIGAALRWHLLSRHLPVADVVGTRLLIETWSLREAASRVGSGGVDLGPVRDLLRRMDDVALPAADFLALDTLFHVALADLAGNIVIAAIMSAMRGSIQGYVTAAVEGLVDWPAMAVVLRAEHAGLLDAVAAGHGELAAGRVASHIEGFYRATGVGQPARGAQPGQEPAGTDGNAVHQREGRH